MAWGEVGHGFDVHMAHGEGSGARDESGRWVW